MKETRQVKAGNVCIGGGAPVTVQSMLSVPAHDIKGSIRQAEELARVGCDVIRVALPDRKAVSLIPALKNAVDVPIVADIHFDYRIALEVDHISRPSNEKGQQASDRNPFYENVSGNPFRRWYYPFKNGQ